MLRGKGGLSTDGAQQFIVQACLAFVQSDKQILKLGMLIIQLRVPITHGQKLLLVLTTLSIYGCKSLLEAFGLRVTTFLDYH